MESEKAEEDVSDIGIILLLSFINTIINELILVLLKINVHFTVLTFFDTTFLCK